jgi:hypothetical protein
MNLTLLPALAGAMSAGALGLTLQAISGDVWSVMKGFFGPFCANAIPLTANFSSTPL